MANDDSNRHAIAMITALGTAAQLAMVIVGHYVPFVKENLFAPLGCAISLAFAVVYARRVRLPRGASAGGGAIVGGLCALIGIAVSVAMGDVPAFVLAVGTGSSTVCGAIGGALAARGARAGQDAV